MHNETNTRTIHNEYEPKSTFRTFTGVASSLLFMGIPVGLTELLRPGGDTLTWQISFLCVAAAVVLAVVSVRGTLEE